jgi:hypothetical protein
LGCQYDRHGVDAGEALKNDALPFHHRQGSGRANISKPQNSGPV